MMPPSNWTKFSYALTSGGFCVIVPAKSWRPKTVFRQSLHIRTSTFTPPVAFSLKDVSIRWFSQAANEKLSRITCSYVQADFQRTFSSGITANHPPTKPAVMTSEGIGRELLLTERAVQDTCIIFPRHNRLLKLFSLVFSPGDRPK